MSKHMFVLLALIVAACLLVSLAKGMSAEHQRAQIIQQCENDPSCTYVPVQK